MISGLEVVGGFTVAMVALGALESFVHRRNLRSIDIRIHVAGTRGKSSVTRLIAAGLNGGGIKALGKTTGTMPRTIFPDGHEVPVFRPIGANIVEQRRIISLAKELHVKAAVVECMALQPILHWVSERMLIRATHGVITNARADHLDVMGPEPEDVALALAGMIPVNGVLYTAEVKHLSILEECAKDRGTKVIAVTPRDVETVTDAEMSGFAYVEHKENVALVLRILADIGIDRETAIRGMWQTKPDPGALTEYKLSFFGREIIFANGFAANDPDSSERIWHQIVARYPYVDKIIAVFNLRGDRPSRTIQLAHDVDFWHAADSVVLLGSGGYLFSRFANRLGIDPLKLIQVEDARVEEAFETIVEACSQKTLVIGLGNIGGIGMELVRFFRNRAVPDGGQQRKEA